MSSKKKRKSLCPFASAKKTSKRKKAKTFTKDRAEALAASDKGSYFEQEKLLTLEDSGEEDNSEEVSASRSKGNETEIVATDLFALVPWQ